MTVPSACEQLLLQAAPLSKGGTLKEPKKGPTVASLQGTAFALDSPGGRELLSLPPESKCADGCFWLPHQDNTLLFVELKSGSIGGAVDQLESVHRAWGRKARELGCDVNVQHAVVMSGSAPVNQKKLKTASRSRTGSRLKLKSGCKKSVSAESLLS